MLLATQTNGLVDRRKLLLKPAIGLFSWYAYSAFQLKKLEKSTFAAMQILAEMRGEHGNRSQIPVIGNKMKELDSLDEDSWHFLAGDADVTPECVRVSKKDEVVFCYSADGKSCALFGRRQASNLSLRELVSKRSRRLEIVEDIYERVNYNQKMKECKPLLEVGDATPIKGAYTFCYRDYVTHEEMLGMLDRRFTLVKFLFRPARAGELKFDVDSKCSLQERGILLGFIPVSIRWEGSIQKGAIVWDTTSMILGWKRFGKTFDRPPAAEKLRKAKWIITVLDDKEKYGDILCFMKEGKGKLVFAKDELLSPISWFFINKPQTTQITPALAL